ncbi:MAG: carbohydrate kinase [Sporolactobacillus sp.]|jgi:L-xylulokinase|nr:carbohydrate kinase [Sporolactobacillus sp.]
MEKIYIMGIDNGGTATKAAIYDLFGHEISKVTKYTQMITPQPFITERNMDELFGANIYVIKESIRKAGIDPKQIMGIGCTGHGNGLYLVDGRGHAVRNGIISTDNRAANFAQKWLNDAEYENIVRPKTLQSVWASQPVALLAWLQEHESSVVDKTKYIFSITDLVRFWLTGNANFEITNASGTSLLNLKTKRIDDELLEFFGIKKWKEKIPPLVNSTDNCGTVTDGIAKLTGLIAGTPVAGGVFDISASAISTGLVNENQLGIVTGTWSINEYITSMPTVEKDLFMTSIYPIPSEWLITEASPTSASNLEWFLNTFLERSRKELKESGKSIYDVCGKLVADTKPEDSNLLFFPFIFGSNSTPDASAALIGATKYHSLKFVLRAVYEGVIFSHMYHIEKLAKINGNLSNTVRIAGGITNSEIWLQMFANALGKSLELVSVKENGALGTAMSASIMTGYYSSFKEAAENMIKVTRTIYPQEEKFHIYQNKFEHYKQVQQAMCKPWKIVSSF